MSCVTQDYDGSIRKCSEKDGNVVNNMEGFLLLRKSE